jgi:monovalent cation:H+ antiporter-2, CPA2 family
MRQLVFGVGAAQLLGAGVLIAIGLYVAGYDLTAAAGIGIALALSSTALVLPISGTKSAVGQSALGMLLFEDLAIVPIIFVLAALAPQVGEAGVWDDVVRALWQGGLVIIAMLVLGRFMLPRLFGQAARTKSPELFVSVSLLVVIVCSLATSAVGLSPIFWRNHSGAVDCRNRLPHRSRSDDRAVQRFGAGRVPDFYRDAD